MEMKPIQCEPDTSINMQKVKDFAEFRFTSLMSIFSTSEQTHSIFSSHISCIQILKDIIRLHPAQFMTSHPDAWQILPS